MGNINREDFGLRNNLLKVKSQKFESICTCHMYMQLSPQTTSKAMKQDTKNIQFQGKRMAHELPMPRDRNAVNVPIPYGTHRDRPKYSPSITRFHHIYHGFFFHGRGRRPEGMLLSKTGPRNQTSMRKLERMAWIDNYAYGFYTSTHPYNQL